MKKKSLLNILASVFSQMVILAFGLIVPRIILSNYGSDTNGLTNTITQIFTYLALLEAGISQASRNALFKYIKSNDEKMISCVMSVTRRYYRKISAIYVLAVLILSFGFPLVAKSQVNYWTIFGVIIFEGMTNVVSFYFVNTWTSFLTAQGKNYITNTVELANKTLCYGVKIVLALFRVNIAIIQLGFFVVSLIKLCVYRYYMTKNYGWINYKSEVTDYKLPDRNSYVVTEITWTIFSSTDMIVLSIFVSTALSSVYSVYNMVFLALNGLLYSVYHALSFNLGQTYHESIVKYTKLHDLFTSTFLGMMTAFMATAYILIIPFVKLYTKGVEDINYFYTWLPLCFCLVQILSWSRYTAGNLIGVAGRAKKAVPVNIIEALINVVLSVALVNRFGITGVLVATVVALPLKIIYCNYIADHVILKRKGIKTIAILTVNYLIFLVSVIIKDFIDLKIETFGSFFVYGALIFSGSLILSFVANALVNRDLTQMIKLLKR